MVRLRPDLMMIDGEGSYEALANVIAQAVAVSPVVVDTPSGVKPSALEALKVAEQVATSVAPVIAPDVSDSKLSQIAKQVTTAVVTNPAVIAAPAGQTVNTTTLQGIIDASDIQPEPTGNRRRGGPDVMQVDDNAVMGTVLDSVITAILNSDAVMNTPANQSPSLEQVQNIASQLLETITPIIAPEQVIEQNYLDQVGETIALQIVNNPEVIAAPAGQAVPATVIEDIVQAVTPEVGRSTASTPTPTPTPTIPTDVASPEAEEYYNRLKGRAGAGIKPTPEEQKFLDNYLIHRANVLKGLQTAGVPLTPAQQAEKNQLVEIGVIGGDKPYTGPVAPTEPTVTGPTAEQLQIIAAKLGQGKTLTPEESIAIGVTPAPSESAPTLVIPTDLSSPEAEELYNKLGGKATAGIKPTPEEQDFLNRYLINRAEVLKGKAPAGLTPAETAEKNQLVEIGVIGDKPYTGPAEPTPTPTPTGGNYEYKDGKMYFNGKPFTGTLAGEEFKDGVSQVASKEVISPKPTGTIDSTTTTTTTATPTVTTSNLITNANTILPPGVTVTSTYIDPKTGDTVGVLSNGTTKVLSAGDTLQTNRVSTMNTLIDRFNKYGLSTLANKIKELAIDGATESTITLQLQETPEYQQRFSANAARIKQGLQVLNPAEYLSLEDGYRQVLRAYGLKAFDTDAYVQQFIANDVSAAELSNRVVTAVQRVQNADPAVQQQLRDYYGISQQDLVAYVLDPQQQFQKIERQVAASEIGVAAGRQGLKPGVAVAEQLAAQGVTQAEAQKGYATIADILPTAEKLSSIYGKTMDTYGQSEAEQEVFNSLASAQRKREKLTARELASFSGAAGTNKTSLTTSSVGQF